MSAPRDPAGSGTDPRCRVFESPRTPSRSDVAATTSAGKCRGGWRQGRVLSDGTVLHGWKQIIAVLVVYALFELVRSRIVSAADVAFDNALLIIDWQQAVGINHELAIQQWSLEWKPLILFSNYFYASTYLPVTFATIVWLYRKRSDAYLLWRNTLALMTTMGLIGFAFFPLMPPRLLELLGDGRTFGFVDTLVEYPTFWSVDPEATRTVSNPFAAMPSLHCAWAIWVACALYPRVKSNTARVLAVLYPIVTVYTVVATANHYFLDAVGGFIVFIVAYLLARLVTRAGGARPIFTRHAPDRSDQGPHPEITVR